MIPLLVDLMLGKTVVPLRGFEVGPGHQDHLDLPLKGKEENLDHPDLLLAAAASSTASW